MSTITVVRGREIRNVTRICWHFVKFPTYSYVEHIVWWMWFFVCHISQNLLHLFLPNYKCKKQQYLGNFAKIINELNLFYYIYLAFFWSVMFITTQWPVTQEYYMSKRKQALSACLICFDCKIVFDTGEDDLPIFGWSPVLLFLPSSIAYVFFFFLQFLIIFLSLVCEIHYTTEGRQR